MDHFPPFISDLALIMFLAGVVIVLFKWLKQPVVLGYILAGIIAGPYLKIFPSVGDVANIQTWAEIGVIFLLFGLGLDFSFKKIINVGKSALITANANILFMLFIGYQVGILMGWSAKDSIFLGGMLSMSSTTIIIKAFEELNLKRQKFTDIVFGILIVEDVMGILLLVILPAFTLSQSINGVDLFVNVLKLFLFFISWFVIGIYIVPTMLKKLAGIINDEILLILSIGLCLGMVFLASKAGFSAALGAFVMGSILAETDEVERIEKIIKPVKDFFGAVFFVSVGMLVNPASFIEYWVPIVIITAVVVAGKVVLSIGGLVISGNTLKTSLLGGFSLAQVGEFAFIIASLGMNIGVLSNNVYPVIVAVSVITTFTTPMMIKAADPVYCFISCKMPKACKLFLQSQTSNAPTSDREEHLWQELFKSYFVRVSIVSIILMAIMNVSFYYAAPKLFEYFSSSNAKHFVTVLTLLIMAPFLKSLLTRREATERIYKILWQRNLANRLPLILITGFRMVLAALFIMIVINHLSTKNMYITYLAVALLLVMLYKSNWLSRQYHDIETQFVTNLNRRRETEAEEKDNQE